MAELSINIQEEANEPSAEKTQPKRPFSTNAFNSGNPFKDIRTRGVLVD